LLWRRQVWIYRSPLATVEDVVDAQALVKGQIRLDLG
jgi:hypothetical protein